MKSISYLVICLCLLLSTHVSAANKKIGIIVFDGVLTSDVTAPLEVFGVASKLSWFSDYEVITIGVNDSKTIKTEEGLSLGVDTSIANAPDLDVILVPSSYTMKPLIKNKQLIEFLRSRHSSLEWIASNCSGAFILGEAGILDGKRATTWAGGEKELQSDYPNIKVQFDQNVVVDGNIITSNGSVVSYQAALTLLKHMSSASKANEVAETIQFARLSAQTY